MKHTHIVLDLVYMPEEGQECFEGTLEECNDYVYRQGGTYFMYKVVPMTEEELEYYNREQ